MLGEGGLLSFGRLTGVDLLAELPPVERRLLARALQPRRYVGGQLIRGSDSRPTVGLILRGRVRLFERDADGREFTLDEVGRGFMLGIEALFGLAGDALAEAATDTLVGMAEPETLSEVLVESPRLRQAMLGQLGSRVQAAESRLQRLLWSDAGTRLSEALVRSGQLRGRWLAEGGVTLDDPPTHVELAREIGCSRETVTRLLAAAERQGLIRRAGRHLTILGVHNQRTGVRC